MKTRLFAQIIVSTQMATAFAFRGGKLLNRNVAIYYHTIPSVWQRP